MTTAREHKQVQIRLKRKRYENGTAALPNAASHQFNNRYNGEEKNEKVTNTLPDASTRIPFYSATV